MHSQSTVGKGNNLMSSPVSLGTVDFKDLKNTWSYDTGASMAAKSCDNLRYKHSNYVDLHLTPKLLEPIFTDIFSSEGSKQQLPAVPFPPSLVTPLSTTLNAGDNACSALHVAADPILKYTDGSRPSSHVPDDPTQEGAGGLRQQTS
jgi:hypothetical protein